MRYEEYIKNVVDEFVNGPQTKIDDLPEFELYMDQALTYMNQKLSVFKKDKKDVIMTKTMINNYTKHKLIPAPINKKYSKDHLILLNMIYYLKRSFQMDEIRKLMKPLIDNYNSEFDEKIDFSGIYIGMLEVQKTERENMLKTVRSDIENIKTSLSRVNLSDDDMLEVFMMIMNLVRKADSQRYLAERLLDEYFIKPSTQKFKKVKRPKIKFDNKEKAAPKEKPAPKVKSAPKEKPAPKVRAAKKAVPLKSEDQNE